MSQIDKFGQEVCFCRWDERIWESLARDAVLDLLPKELKGKVEE